MSSAPPAVRDGSALADLPGLQPPEFDGDPGWLAALRGRAWQWVATHGFPTRKHEDWRYVDLQPLLATAFLPSWDGDGDPAARSLQRVLGPGLGGLRLVFRNGRFIPGLSRLSPAPPGLRLTTVGAAIRDGDPVLQVVWGGPDADTWSDGFEALNAALATDGGLVEVAPGVALDTPVELVHLAGGEPDPVLSNPRTAIHAGAGSRITVVESYLGWGPASSLTNARTRLTLGEGADVEHYRIQAGADEGFHLSSVTVDPGPRSRFVSGLLATGSRLARHELRAALAAEGASVEAIGLYLAAGSQCHDNPVRIEHVAPGCASNQVYRGIVEGSGRGVFNGHVIVHPGAVRTDAHQVNKNLLLSDQAEVDTRPRLEIFADDVACTHGAAVGQVDPDALFYLRCRGVPESRARAMLVEAFAEDVLARFRPGPISRLARELVASRLGPEPPGAGPGGGADS